MGLRDTGAAWLVGLGNGRSRGGGRHRSVLAGRRQLPRNGARSGAVARGAAASAAPRPSGHRVVVVDAGGRPRRRAAAAGRDALRIGRRRNGNDHRAADHLFAGDSGAADWIGEAGVVGVPRGDAADMAGARVAGRAGGRRGDPARDWRGDSALQGDRDAGGEGGSIQWGGQVLYADGRYAMPDGKAHFAAVSIGRSPAVRVAEEARESSFVVSTRRGSSSTR